MTVSSSFNEASQPILVEITRGSIVESRNRGAIAIVSGGGTLVASAGDTEFVSYLRSAAKPHQTIAVVLSGAADHFKISAKELSLMSGSHSGEPYHAECAASILDKIGLQKNALKCGIHSPFSRTAAKALGDSVNELHNNCSGKHAGMLAQALHGGYSTEDYYSLDHPVQKYITSIVAEFADCKESDLVVAIDGCTVATFGMSIATMAFVYAKLVNAGSLRERLQMATNRVVTAMLDYPEMVAADTGRIDTDLMRLLPGRLVAKAGAEGVYTMGLKPCQRYPEGLGIALKIEDGEIGRSRNVVAIETLSQLGLINTEQKQKLFESYVPPIKNNRSMIVGEVRPAFELKFLS